MYQEILSKIRLLQLTKKTKISLIKVNMKQILHCVKD